MKKSTLLLIVLSLLAIQLSAQQKKSGKEKENQKVAAAPSTLSLEKLIQQKSNSFIITDEHVSKNSGNRHVYL